MFASSQYGAVQYGSVSSQAPSGYLITVFEGFSLSDSALIDASFFQDEQIVLQDNLTIIGIGLLQTEVIRLIDTALFITPGEGTQIGDWRRTPRITGVWTPIPN